MSTENRNIITTYNGVEIYNDDISMLCHEYESQFTDDIEERINKSMFFTGLVVYLNRHLFKNITGLKYNNDYNALNDLFYDCFVPLCSKYNKTVTLQNFCLMTGIDNSLLSQILSGSYNDGSKVKTETFQTVKKWKDTAESALIESGMSGNPVFSIFALKAGHAWKDNSQETTATELAAQSTPEQIQQRYKDAKRPEIPVFEDDNIT